MFSIKKKKTCGLEHEISFRVDAQATGSHTSWTKGCTGQETCGRVIWTPIHSNRLPRSKHKELRSSKDCQTVEKPTVTG